MSFLGWFRRAPAVARIEPLGTEHAARLSSIHGAAFARPWSAVEFERLLADRAVFADGLFLARDAVVSGFVVSHLIADEAEVLTVAMAPEARGRHHAHTLLMHHLDELARAGARTVHLEVDESNAAALALYRRLGFREVGHRAGYYRLADGTRAAALAMSRPL
jgi:ribosomal-protein-alanine N-acetyltransferase